jgi:hypothetical protein
LRLDHPYSNVKNSGTFLAGGGSPLIINLGTKESGTPGVLHQTIRNTLDNQIAGGDAPFMLEFTDEKGKVFSKDKATSYSPRYFLIS